jgi:hypothetical protein
MVDVYGEGKKLFHNYVQDLVDLGWKKEQLLPNVFIMTDTVGKKAFVSCEVDKMDLQREIYGITAKLETEEKDIYKVHLGTLHEGSVIVND